MSTLRLALDSVVRWLLDWLPVVVLCLGLVGMAFEEVFSRLILHQSPLPEAVTVFGAMITSVGVLQKSLADLKTRLPPRPTDSPPKPSLPPLPPPEPPLSLAEPGIK